MRIRIKLNGIGREDEVEPRLLLVHYLREVAGLTGTHIGCETSISPAGGSGDGGPGIRARAAR